MDEANNGAMLVPESMAETTIRKGDMVRYPHPDTKAQCVGCVQDVDQEAKTAQVQRRDEPDVVDTVPFASMTPHVEKISIVSTRKGQSWIDSLETKTMLFAPTGISDRCVKGIASVTGVLDDGDDIVHKGAFRKTLQENAGRVRHLWNHDFTLPPTATIRELKEIDAADLPTEIRTQHPYATGGLYVERDYLDTPRGNEILAGLRAGAIREMSVGFNTTQKDYSLHEGKSIRNIRQVRLLDTSDVPWGMNPASVASFKSALPFHEGPKLEKDAPWDGQAEIAKAKVAQLKTMCAWVDPEQAEVKAGYKLPYRTAEGKLSWAGTKAAMGALMGARGGVIIPERDRRGVYDTLAKAYREFDEEPPDFKSAAILWSVADARNMMATGVEFKAGRRNSSADEDKLKRVIALLEQGLETLEDLLGIQEPPDGEAAESTSTQMKALVNRALVQRLKIAEHELGLMR